MVKNQVVYEYCALDSASRFSPTFSYDNETVQAAIDNGVDRPKGYTVSWHHNPEMEKMHFGPKHPMKPWRLTLTKEIVLAYGMQYAMDCFIPRAAKPEELKQFHKSDYVEFLRRVTPDQDTWNADAGAYDYNTGDDCPIFDGLYEYCSTYGGCSLDAARKLTNKQSDIAINWSGGLHHAKKGEASGFCYINDIVLAILQLLIYHPRVLYIDIDVHHGDGVEQAFWSNNRVMTLSFHKYCKESFFPGTGALDETGPTNNASPGAHHSLNVPLNDGIEDDQYINLFKQTVGPCIEVYNPNAIVIQCGADSLGGDRLGCFNLNVQAHGECVNYVKSFDLPLLVVGGGGYTARNVAKAWAYETSICIGAEVDPQLPKHTPFLQHFGSDETLFPPLSDNNRYENKNSNTYLQSLVMGIREQLRYLEGSPSVQMTEMPPDLGGWMEDAEREFQEILADKDRDRRRKERHG